MNLAKGQLGVHAHLEFALGFLDYPVDLLLFNRCLALEDPIALPDGSLPPHGLVLLAFDDLQALFRVSQLRLRRHQLCATLKLDLVIYPRWIIFFVLERIVVIFTEAKGI